MQCSIIIPTIGRASLERAVRSVLEDGHDATDCEIIVVNDSGKPLAQQAWLIDHGIRVITTSRSGVCMACNAGAAIARGKYLKFLHDDDYLLTGGLAKLLEVAENSGCVWAIGGSRVVDELGRVLAEHGDRVIPGNSFALWIADEVVHIDECLISRQAFIQVGGFDPAIKIAEDRDLECRLALHYEVAGTDRVVACIRVAGSDGSAFDFANIAHYWRLIRERAFDAPDALCRVQDSVETDVVLRGRVCRSYLNSGVLNLRSGKVWLAGSRFTCSLRLMGWHCLTKQFWLGLLFNKRAMTSS